MEAYQIALLLGIGLAIAELLTLSFLFLGMAVAAWVVAALEYLSGNFNFNRDIVVFALASALFFVVFRKLFKKQTDTETLQSQDINHY